MLSGGKPNYEHEEIEESSSLGILTPDQMNDFAGSANNILEAKSCENLISNPSVPQLLSNKHTEIPVPQPRVNQNFRIEKPKKKVRHERSPSVEDLPLDPKPEKSVDYSALGNVLNIPVTLVLTDGGEQADPTRGLPVSFVTSVTSITSLEAGYQGDGENSRPASRGAESLSVTAPSTSIGSAVCR